MEAVVSNELSEALKGWKTLESYRIMSSQVEGPARNIWNRGSPGVVVGDKVQLPDHD